MKLSLQGLVGYLTGKGVKVHLNEDANAGEDVFDITEEPVVPVIPETPDESPDDVLSAEELVAMKDFARALTKNQKLIEAIGNGSLELALTTVPAAAELVRNAQARDKVEKDQLIAEIKTNDSNVYSDAELEALPSSVLVKMNAQMNVNYIGLGGATFQNSGEEAPLALPSMFVKQVEEVKNGS